jgi:hypothetical protein
MLAYQFVQQSLVSSEATTFEIKIEMGIEVHFKTLVRFDRILWLKTCFMLHIFSFPISCSLMSRQGQAKLCVLISGSLSTKTVLIRPGAGNCASSSWQSIVPETCVERTTGLCLFPAGEQFAAGYLATAENLIFAVLHSFLRLFSRFGRPIIPRSSTQDCPNFTFCRLLVSISKSQAGITVEDCKLGTGLSLTDYRFQQK